MNKTYRMLLIDDSCEVLNILKTYFDMKNFDVVGTQDSLEGLRILANDNKGFDIVLTDLVMPNLSGVGIISIAKKKYPNIIVIAMTGWGKHPKELAGEAKADAVIEKPIQLPKLESMIFELLEKMEMDFLKNNSGRKIQMQRIKGIKGKTTTY